MQSITHAGLQKTGAIDYPGLLASIIFLPGCNLRCPYCHNPNLVTEIDKSTLIPIDEILAFLKKRAGIIGGVVISGGEPLIYPVEDIDELIHKIQSLGLRVKLDTNGMSPDKLLKLSPDFIAMDIKTSPSEYYKLTTLSPITEIEKDKENKTRKEIEENIKKSIKWIISSGIEHEFRTTVAPGIFEEKDLDIIIPLLQGANQWSLTAFKQGKTLDPEWEEKLPPKRSTLEYYKKKIDNAGIPCILRN